MDEDVARALNAIPHDYKMALLLVDIQGHSYQEVADMLAVPVGTVMSRLFRGRTKIEKALISYGKRYNYLSRPLKRSVTRPSIWTASSIPRRTRRRTRARHRSVAEGWL
jgi:RNA polymerase sigma-70 factor (ECF subfamily)